MILPNNKDIVHAARKAKKKVEAYDFRSFFYQIQLSDEVKKFFRIIINEELYELNVLPMGSVFSPFVAQSIAFGVSEKLRLHAARACTPAWRRSATTCFPRSRNERNM
jgi:hypothetical protein